MPEKAIIWTLFPAQQVFILAALRLANIDARVFYAGLSISERTNLVRVFSPSRDTCTVIICSYSVNSWGLYVHRHKKLYDENTGS